MNTNPSHRAGWRSTCIALMLAIVAVLPGTASAALDAALVAGLASEETEK